MKLRLLLLATLGLAVTTASYGQNTYPWSASGNVGIGTTSPAEKFDVRGNAFIGTHSGAQVAIGNSGTEYPSIGFNIAYTGLGNTWNYRFSDTASLLRFHQGGFQFKVASAGSSGSAISFADAMSITSSGNVGIGTTTPQTPLHVIGPITAGYNNSTWGEDYLYGAYGSGKLFVLGSQYSSGASFLGYAVKAKHLAVGYVSSTEITIPRAAIEASGEGVTILTGPSQTSTDGGSINISERMRIDPAGNVGIGTTYPTAKLEVVGSVSVNCEQAGFVADAAGLRRVGFMKYPGLEGAIVHSGSTPFRFGRVSTADVTIATQEAFTEEARFDGNGNFGIGTTSPTEKLSVNGKIRAKEVIVETTGWSDYVFAKDYKLAPLSEVELHIEQQGHLPGVPSAKEVAEKGVSVGDMQAILLAKIEELTLHQIAQEKAISSLQNKVQSLEAENAQLKVQTK